MTDKVNKFLRALQRYRRRSNLEIELRLESGYCSTERAMAGF